MEKVNLQLFAVDSEEEEETAEDHAKQDEHGDGEKTDEKEETTKTFTQEQVNSMMAREKAQGRNAAYKELGLNPRDKKSIEAFKKMIEGDDSPKDESQDASSSLLEEMELKLLVSEAKTEAFMMGYKEEFIDDAVTLSINDAFDLEDVKLKLTELKEKYPGFLKADDDSKQPDGTGSTIGTKRTSKAASKHSIGKRLAMQSKVNQPKKSYWE